MNPEASFALIFLSAVFASVLGFLWWFFRDSLHRLELRNDRFAEQFSEFKAESATDRAVLASRLTLLDEKVNVTVKKTEEHGATLLLLMPRVAVLEEEEQMHQTRGCGPDPEPSTIR